jgi:hypothetical protein
MATRVAENVIHPSGMPVQCSGCFNQDPTARHIDFDAAIDRGWYGQDPATKIAMDDLVLCEGCIGTAARLLNWMPTEEFQNRLATLENRIEEEKKRADKAEDYAQRMEDALKHRPQQLTVSKPRKRGRPALAGVQED